MERPLFNGDRYQTTMRFSIPPEAWNEQECRVTPAAYNHKNTPSTTINAFVIAMEKAVNRLENYARVQNASLTKPIVKKVVADVIAAGGEFPYDQEKAWRKMLSERFMTYRNPGGCGHLPSSVRRWPDLGAAV